MTSAPGTYAVLWNSPADAAVRVGRWGRLELVAGYYVYVGSAFGPGGVRARVNRHYRRSKPDRWHIDYLRAHLTPVGAWYTHHPRYLEHQWAEAFSSMSTTEPIPGFGASDCHCNSHLFYMSKKPSVLRGNAILPCPANASVPDVQIEFSFYDESTDHD